MLGRKQSANNEDFLLLAREIESHVSRAQIVKKAKAAAAEVRERTRSARAAFAWSGGKDSLALQGVCRLAGVGECMMGITHLEYPAFLQWVTDNMPEGLTVINTGQDLDWLVSHPQMLFPPDATTAAKWFRVVQHTAQERYFKENKLDVLLLGRRRADGNYVGVNGENFYTSRGVTRYSPLADWSHADVIAFNHYFAMPVPPCYAWPNGFVVGTGAWAARQYTRKTGEPETQGWREVFSIDPSVVEAAATKLEGARRFLDDLPAKKKPKRPAT